MSTSGTGRTKPSRAQAAALSKIAWATIVALALFAPWSAASAQSPQGNDPQKGVEDLTREGIDNLMKALQLLLSTIPQYEAPTIDENGDIIIRRKRPPAPKSNEKTEPDSQTKT
ncbi:MAG TPA: hypothetical protein VEJ16_12520 [Alphaproteobacteria bacterium]|nr:hypothetical protein [Alphaproteobacteria bacterium]